MNHPLDYKSHASTSFQSESFEAFNDNIKYAAAASVPLNYHEKTAVWVVTDQSGSMSIGPRPNISPIAEANAGLQSFYTDIKQDINLKDKLEVGLIGFSDNATLLRAASLLNENELPPQLSLIGGTKYCPALKLALSEMDQWKSQQKEWGIGYKRPWIVFITDGGPCDNQGSLEQMIQEFHQRWAVNPKSFEFMALGVEGANLQILNRFCKPEKPAMYLKDSNFKSFFKFLSESMSAFSQAKEGEKVEMSDEKDWFGGFEA